MLTILSNNIRSINANLDSFVANFFGTSPDISVFTETWNKGNDVGPIPGFHVQEISQLNSRSGGVSIVIRIDFSSSLMTHRSFASDLIEYCTVELLIGNTKLVIAGVHKPIHSSTDSFAI